MDMDQGQIYDSRSISILLVSASLVLLANGIYTVMFFSIQYGLGVGAALQSSAYNISTIPALQFVAGNINVLYQTMLESYLLAGIGIVMFAVALVMLIHGSGRYESYVRKYVPIHAVLAFVYIVMLLIIHSTYSATPFGINLYAAYAALAVCILLDVYLEYKMRALSLGRLGLRSIRINPATPYANLVKLKEELFDKLSGDIYIVDKHFNSAAIANLHRMLPNDMSKIRSLRVVTSADMLNSGFAEDYRDLKQELKNNGVELEVRIMSDAEAAMQHERFILDGKIAYKIPPFNIINKKSEHIVKMSMGDAKRRFEYLANNSAKIENYLLGRSKNAERMG